MENKKETYSSVEHALKSARFWFVLVFVFFMSIIVSYFPNWLGIKDSYEKEGMATSIHGVEEVFIEKPLFPPLDKELYDRLLERLANNPVTVVEGQEEVKPNLWPVDAPYPKDGAILPFKRIIAYYGNLYSTKMGVLGEYPEEEMLSRLMNEVEKWEKADPEIPVQPALHYITVTAQLHPGEDGKHRLRMPQKEIDKVLEIAKKIDAIVFLDFQVGFSTLENELPVYEKYLKLPNVHLGIDPEFSMKGTIRPGKVVGTYDAKDINYAIEYLSKLVKENNLPPKVLVIHRYTQKMVTNFQEIKPQEEVQVVIHMDGWGGKAKKKNTYERFIFQEPVQFTGFKIFYKNDIWDPGTVLFTPEELLKLRPIPIYIQYQ
ncbi:MAG: hypothetical protein WC898_01175 [Candidatus Paceibacterota bacterium]|jgi:hypothetical protein